MFDFFREIEAGSDSLDVLVTVFENLIGFPSLSKSIPHIHEEGVRV